MCVFNGGCPGVAVYDGFNECSIETGCASGPIYVSFADARRFGLTLKEIKERKVAYNTVDISGVIVPDNNLLNLPSWYTK